MYVTSPLVERLGAEDFALSIHALELSLVKNHRESERGGQEWGSWGGGRRIIKRIMETDEWVCRYFR